MIGMPASVAAASEACNAGKSGTETTRPSGPVATAASMSEAISVMSKVAGAE